MNQSASHNPPLTKTPSSAPAQKPTTPNNTKPAAKYLIVLAYWNDRFHLEYLTNGVAANPPAMSSPNPTPHRPQPELCARKGVVQCGSEAGNPAVDMQEWHLIERARRGDIDAFTLLVRRYQHPVVHFCQRMLGSTQDAEDVAQETFVRVYRYLDRIQPDAKFSTLLFGIARNLTLNHLRDTKRRGRGTTDPLENHAGLAANSRRPDQAARLGEIQALIQKGLHELTPEHREVLVLREINGLDYEAIASVLDCPIGTVKSRIARAREQLQARIKSLGGDLI